MTEINSAKPLEPEPGMRPLMAGETVVCARTSALRICLHSAKAVVSMRVT